MELVMKPPKQKTTYAHSYCQSQCCRIYSFSISENCNLNYKLIVKTKDWKNGMNEILKESRPRNIKLKVKFFTLSPASEVNLEYHS
jgi:hypothetical protein